MAKASSYANDSTITGTDKLFGTDGADNSSKNYLISDLETYFSTNGNLASIAGVETLTNKTMDFSTGGTNTLTADAVDIIYSNSTSGLTAVNTQAAIDEIEGRVDTSESNISTNTSDIATNALDIASNQGNIATNTTNISTNAANITANADSITTAEGDILQLESQVISYNTDSEATASYSILATDNWKILAAGAGVSMARTLTSTVLGNMDTNALFAIQNTDGNALEVTLTDVTAYGHISGTITIDNQGDLVWFQKIDSTNVAMWGDFTITP